MFWDYAQESEASNSASASSKMSNPSLSSRAMPSVSQCCEGVGQASESSTTLPALTAPNSEALTLSRQDSPANRGASRANRAKRKTRDGFGQSSPRLFATLCRVSFSWRTSQDCSAAESKKFAKTWPQWGSMRNGECFLAEPWEPRTCADDCSYWPTPVRTLVGHNTSNGVKRPSLDNLAAAWPTPTARDWRSDKSNITSNARPLSEVVYRFGHTPRIQTGAKLTRSGGRLNSLFVEWLMGFPSHWSRTEEPDCKHWVTQCRHLLQGVLGEC